MNIGNKFDGEVYCGTYGGWPTLGVRIVRDGKPTTEGAIFAILFERPTLDTIMETIDAFGGDCDETADSLVTRYGGYSVYIPMTLGEGPWQLRTQPSS